MNRSTWIGFAFLCCAVTAAAAASGASELVTEEPTEQSLRAIAQQLRCPVCQGETLYDSQSSLATEMREIIREQLAEQRTEAEIIAFFVERYGDYVRLAPRFGGAQLAVWLLPLVALVLGAVGVTAAVRRRERETAGERDR